MLRLAGLAVFLALNATAGAQTDISTVAPDLTVPPVENVAPAPGKRVFYRLPGDPENVPAMVLYLPTNWSPEKKYPVLCEYAGNGNYQNAFGDISTGRPEGSQLGYGLSGGKGFIWVCLPFLNDAGDGLAITWWGDKPTHRPEATVAHAKRAVPAICAAFSGDPGSVILCGFSRGAIACNAIGLHDDEIAKLWRGFVCYSHYDGVRGWPFAGADRDSALTRLRRLGNRPQFICHEEVSSAGVMLDATRAYLKSSEIAGDFTFQTTGFRNHNDAWTLRPSPAREAARAWLKKVTAE
jgi:hypothetical protein